MCAISIKQSQIKSNPRKDLITQKSTFDCSLVKTPFDSIHNMEAFINNPGLQHLAEMIFLNLNHEILDTCALVNQSFKFFLENHPMFWLKKLIFEGRLNKKNQKMNWTTAIHLTKKTNFRKNLTYYLKTILKNNQKRIKNFDIPCYIDKDIINEANIYLAKECGSKQAIDRYHYKAGFVQIFASKVKRSSIHWAARNGHIDVIKSLIPLESDDYFDQDGLSWTAFHEAVLYGQTEIVKFLAPFFENLIVNSSLDEMASLIAIAENKGHVEIVKFLKNT